MVEQGVMVEFVGGKMAMASSSTSNCALPPKDACSGYFLYPPPLATYEEVVASPDKFRDTLEKLHAAMGTKFMIPIVGGQELDLHRLFVEVTYRGGLAKTLRDKKWKAVTGVFSFPSSATNASFILRKYYYSLLIHYEQIYFFKAVGFNPESINALRSASRVPAPSHGSSESVLSSPSTQAAGSPASGVNTTKSLPEASAGSPVHGVIDGKFESGYLITVKIGSEEFRGVLYQATLGPSQQEQRHASSKKCQIVSVNNSNSASASTSRVVRRKRRKKSEIKKRDPDHPKPNRSGYNFFFAEQHARLKPLYPGKDREISRMIGESWNKLQESEKAIYQEKAAIDKERYRIEMEGYRERLRTGQMISNAMPIRQLPPEPSTVMDMEKKLDEDANASHAPGNVTSSSKSVKSSLDPCSKQIINDVISMQRQHLQPETNVMDLDKNLHANGENSLSIPENETSSSSKSEKSNLDESRSQIFNNTIPVQQQHHDSDVNMIDVDKKLQIDSANTPTSPENETSTNKIGNINLDANTRRILNTTTPMQKQPHDVDVHMIDLEKEFQTVGANSPTIPENETSSTKTENINLNASSMMILNDAIPAQQQSHEPDVNMMDEDQKLQTKAAPRCPENETNSDNCNKHISEDNGSAVNTAKEILNDEAPLELRKGMERDASEDKESAEKITVENPKKILPYDERISLSIEGNILPSSEERGVVPSTAEDIVPSHA